MSDPEPIDELKLRREANAAYLQQMTAVAQIYAERYAESASTIEMWRLDGHTYFADGRRPLSDEQMNKPKELKP